MVGAHERRIDGKFRERRLAWKKKGSWPQNIPVPLSNVSAPGASIYLKLITYAHILLIAILYFDRIIQDLKLTKQKYIGLLRPYFCLFAQDF